MSRKKRKRGRPRTLLPQKPQVAATKNPGGRPQGILKKYPFEQTRLGFMLKYESPVVFDLIVELSPPLRKNNPHPTLVAAVCAASHDTAFEKPKFRVYMGEYIRCGVYCKRGKKLTQKRAQYYQRIRHNKLQQYIRQHAAEIELMRLGFSQQEGI